MGRVKLTDYLKIESKKRNLKIFTINCNTNYSKFIRSYLTNDKICLIDEVCTESQLEYVMKNGKPDLAIINIELDIDYNGYELAKILKTEYDIPFYVLLKDSNPRSIKWAQELNPNGIEFISGSIFVNAA